MDDVLNLAPNCQIVRILGSGGMGVVYEGWDPKLERRVALKILHPHLTVEKENRDRLLREARLAARVEHAHIVHIYRVDEYDGQLAIEMQFVQGRPLHRMLASRPLTADQVADLMRQVLDALSACHLEGVIHCDLKPANLLVTPAGKVFLTDFGISRALYTSGQWAASHELSGPLWGTPQYCPPETWEGKPPTPYWDLYALGILAYESLTAALPFDAKTPATLMREKLERRYIPLATRDISISRELAQLIDALSGETVESHSLDAAEALRLLARVPESVSATSATQTLRQKTDEILDDPAARLPAYLTIPQTSQPGPPLAPRKKWLLAAGLAALVLTAFITGALLTRQIGHPQDITSLMPPPIEEKPGEIHELAVIGGKPYFSYSDGQEKGREMWSLGDDGHAFLLRDINPGGPSSGPKHFMPQESGAGLFFTATTFLEGEELWYCANGARTENALWLVEDSIPGEMSGQPHPRISVGNIVLFSARHLEHNTVLRFSNGVEPQTGTLRNKELGTLLWKSPSPRFTANGQEAYFLTGSERLVQHTLWHYTRADNEIKPVLTLDDADVGPMIMFKGLLFVAYHTNQFGHEIYVYRPKADKLELFVDVHPQHLSSLPGQMFVWGEHMLFAATTHPTGRELWTTDGTPEGTALLCDIDPGPGSGDPYGFTIHQDRVYFRARNEEHGQELWVTDGTMEGTHLAADIAPGSASSDPYNLASIGGQFFCTANDQRHGEELWRVTSDDAELVIDLWEGALSAEPHTLQAMDEHSGIFIYKRPQGGDNLMILKVVEDNVELQPVAGLEFAG